MRDSDRSPNEVSSANNRQPTQLCDRLLEILENMENHEKTPDHNGEAAVPATKNSATTTVHSVSVGNPTVNCQMEHTTQTLESIDPQSTDLNTTKSKRKRKKPRQKKDRNERKKTQREMDYVTICTQNVNGIQKKTIDSDFTLYLSQKFYKDCLILGLAETNIDWKDYALYQEIKAICRNIYHRAQLIGSSSSSFFKGDWKPGGKAILLNAQMTSLLIAYGNDSLGRWAWAKLRRHKKKDLLIVQLYISQENYEIITSATQQYIELYEKYQEPPHIRDTFAKDLKTFIAKHQSEVLVMGDFNLPVEDTFIQRIISENDLFDTTTICGRPNQRKINTYKRGKNKIDYALATWALLPDIEDVVYGDFESYADHRPLYIKLKWDLSKLKPNTKRNLFTKHHRRALKFRSTLYKKCESQNIPKQLKTLRERLQTTKSFSKKQKKRFIRLDTFLTMGMTRTTKGSKIPFHIPWSPEIDRKHYFYKLCWRFCKKPTPQLETKLQKLIGEKKEYVNNKPHVWNRKKYSEAVSDLHQTRKDAEKWRHDHYEDQIDAALLKQDMSRFKMLQNILRSEEMKKSFNKLKWLLQKPKRKSNQFGIPGAQGWESVTEERDITHALRSEFIYHFTQAQETPFVTDGNDAKLRNILTTTDPSKWEEQIKELDWIYSKEISINVPKIIPYHLTNDDLIKGFKKWKESKITSPSQLSLIFNKILTNPKDD